MASVNEKDVLQNMNQQLKHKNDLLMKQMGNLLKSNERFALEVRMLDEHMDKADTTGKRFFRKAREDVIGKFISSQLGEDDDDYSSDTD